MSVKRILAKTHSLRAQKEDDLSVSGMDGPLVCLCVLYTLERQPPAKKKRKPTEQATDWTEDRASFRHASSRDEKVVRSHHEKFEKGEN